MTSTFKTGFRAAADKARNDRFIEVGRALPDLLLISNDDQLDDSKNEYILFPELSYFLLITPVLSGYRIFC